MSEPFTGTINVDIRDSERRRSTRTAKIRREWRPGCCRCGTARPRSVSGTIRRVAVDVSGDPYVDLEREAAAMLMRE